MSIVARLIERRSAPDGPTVLKAGTIFNVTHGEYSDYSVLGTMRVLKDFAPVEEFRAFVRGAVDEGEDTMRLAFGIGDRDGFLAHLVHEGYVEDVVASTLHLGAYGEVFAGIGSDEYIAYGESDEPDADDEFFLRATPFLPDAEIYTPKKREA
jgi:hypothetical protein